MTALELLELNEALLPRGEIVTVRDDGVTYQHNRLVVTQNIEDPVAFAAVYGVTVAP